MGRMRKSYTENFKRKVAIEAIREKKTIAEIATEYGVAPSLVTEWKQHFINGEDSLRELQRQYNSERPHQGLEYETPDAVYERGMLPCTGRRYQLRSGSLGIR